MYLPLFGDAKALFSLPTHHSTPLILGKNTIEIRPRLVAAVPKLLMIYVRGRQSIRVSPNSPTRVTHRGAGAAAAFCFVNLELVSGGDTDGTRHRVAVPLAVGARDQFTRDFLAGAAAAHRS